MSEFFLFLYLFFCFFMVVFLERTLVSYFLLFCAIYSFFGLVLFDFGYNVPFGLGQGIEQKLIMFPIYVVASCSVFFSIGQRISFNSKKFKVGESVPRIGFKQKQFKSNALAIFPLLTTMLVILSVGIDNLLIRDSYVVSDANLTFRKFADITVWIAIISIPFIKNKTFRFICHFLLLSVFVGLGSRSAMVIAFSYPLFNYFINNLSKFKIFIHVVLAILLSVTVMQVRFQSNRGLIPVLDNILSWNIEFDMSLYVINYLTSYSILLFSEYINNHAVDFKYFFMSISPLPGFMIDIDGLDQWARFRKSIPHSAISQLYGHIGLFLTLSVFLLHGFVCGIFKNRILRTFKNSYLLLSSLVIVDLLFLIPVIRGMQYNLRGVTRLEYFVLAITIFFVFIFYLKRTMKRKSW
ncbi:hypothetical protein [Shewanella algae]|uniref:hypothetical protein n=1 Tax=Shewanella algae TaxID=38313 RepID=UPI0031F4AE7F